MSGLTEADFAAIEKHLDALEAAGKVPRRFDTDGCRFEVVINSFAFSLLDLLTERINKKLGTAYTNEEVAAQCILRELRKVRP